VQVLEKRATRLGLLIIDPGFTKATRLTHNSSTSPLDRRST
jgi:hypothetical protein